MLLLASPVMVLAVLIALAIFLARRVWRYPLFLIGVTCLVDGTMTLAMQLQRVAGELRHESSRATSTGHLTRSSHGLAWSVSASMIMPISVLCRRRRRTGSFAWGLTVPGRHNAVCFDHDRSSCREGGASWLQRRAG
ncbi:MAG: hypothetical protein ACRDTE_02370 [Pseudonocardiaceae bacterium]